MKCPLCDVELQMAERQGIEMDYCVKCRGVWLDRGELDKIIERSLDQDDDRHEYERERDDDRRPAYYADHGDSAQPHRRRRSLLGELFDVFD